jgi:hypothetical protein
VRNVQLDPLDHAPSRVKLQRVRWYHTKSKKRQRTSTLVASAKRWTRASISGWSSPLLSGSERAGRSCVPIREALSLLVRPVVTNSGGLRPFNFLTGDSSRRDVFFLMSSGVTPDDLFSMEVFMAEPLGVVSTPDTSNGMRRLRGIGDRNSKGKSPGVEGNIECGATFISLSSGKMLTSTPGNGLSSELGLCGGKGDGARGPMGLRSLEDDGCKTGLTGDSSPSCPGVGVTER